MNTSIITKVLFGSCVTLKHLLDTILVNKMGLIKNDGEL